jgi:D-Tyr-tRNAtyr deacylase
VLPILDLFKGAISEWWLKASFIRKLGDAIVALMLGVMILAGITLYERRDNLWRLLSVNFGQHVLDHALGKAETTEFLNSVAARGVVAAFVMEVDVAAGRRAVIAHSALPEVATQMAQLAEQYREVALVTASYTLAEYKKIFQGQPVWSPSPTTRYLRLIVPIPPIYAETIVGMLVIQCDPNMSETNRAVIENLALRWATRLAGL